VGLLPNELKLVVMNGISITTKHSSGDETERSCIPDLGPGIEQDCIGPRGNRGQCADAQCEREHRRQRKARRHAQLAYRVTQVLAEHLGLHFFSELLQLVLRDDLAVEQVHLALGVLGETRIVRHHANRRAFAVQVCEQMHHGLAVL
jgi:hypothetical protein